MDTPNPIGVAAGFHTELYYMAIIETIATLNLGIGWLLKVGGGGGAIKMMTVFLQSRFRITEAYLFQ